MVSAAGRAGTRARSGAGGRVRVLLRCRRALLLRLRRSAMQDWQTAYTAQAADFTDQLNTELLRIRTQMKYTLTRSVTLRLTLTPRQASFPALYDSIQRMTEQVYTMQNTSSLIQSTTAYFPSLNKTIHSSGTYNDPTALEQQLIEAYYAAPGHSAVLTVGGRLYLVSDATSFNNKTSTALVWAELSTAMPGLMQGLGVTLRLLPPLNIDQADLDSFVTTLEDILKAF